jgi:hypothetical protein
VINQKRGTSNEWITPPLIKNALRGYSDKPELVKRTQRTAGNIATDRTEGAQANLDHLAATTNASTENTDKTSRSMA